MNTENIELDARLNVRLTEKMKDDIEKAAKEMNIGTAQVVRDAIELHINRWKNSDDDLFAFLKEQALELRG